MIASPPSSIAAAAAVGHPLRSLGERNPAPPYRVPDVVLARGPGYFVIFTWRAHRLSHYRRTMAPNVPQAATNREPLTAHRSCAVNDVDDGAKEGLDCGPE